LYQFVNHFFTTTAVPNVVSISYGWSEADQCDIDQAECLKLGVNSQGYVERVNAEFQKIALRGISVMVASGDSGANGRTDPDCTLPYLKPDYPAACPYITAVGATQLTKPTFGLTNPPPICSGQGYQCPNGGEEEAVSYAQANFASGGGFSNYAPMPSYQTAAVQNYLKTESKLPPASYFNASGRAYPDVAAIGSAVLIYQGGVQAVGGTSCSAPEFASVVSILNQYAITKTGAPLGFLNPFLYQMAAAQPDAFHDITVGNNICTEDGCSPACKGYYCAPGWDPVSGLGSPNTANMISYIQANL
jgi:tripeptidyl-peptidase-1